MRSVPDRSVITDKVIEILAGADLLVGDVVAPSDGGWQDEMGKVNSTFVPYVVVTPGNAPAPTGSLGDSSSEWQLPYTLTTFGVNRVQVEHLADDARRVMADTRKVNVTMRDGVTTWKITQVTSTMVGGVGYTTQVDPTAFSQTDSVLLWLSKNL